MDTKLLRSIKPIDLAMADRQKFMGVGKKKWLAKKIIIMVMAVKIWEFMRAR